MSKQEFNFPISKDELRKIGIVNLPQFFQSSKQVLTYAIATLAILNAEYLQGDEDRNTQITHLKELQLFIKFLEEKERKNFE